jgi:hypothetical protein
MSDGTPDRLKTDPGHEFEDVDWQMYHAPRIPGPRAVTMQGFADKDWPQAMACMTVSSLIFMSFPSDCYFLQGHHPTPNSILMSRNSGHRLNQLDIGFRG